MYTCNLPINADTIILFPYSPKQTQAPDMAPADGAVGGHGGGGSRGGLTALTRRPNTAQATTSLRKTLKPLGLLMRTALERIGRDSGREELHGGAG